MKTAKYQYLLNKFSLNEPAWSSTVLCRAQQIPPVFGQWAKLGNRLLYTANRTRDPVPASPTQRTRHAT
jgi:hypothetical protein